MSFRLKVFVAVLGLLAVLLVVAPLVVPIAPPAGVRPLAEVAGPDARYVEVRGVGLHVELEPERPVEGRPTVLLLHGFPSSTYTFHEIVGKLEGVNTIAVDLPGFGLSQRPGPSEFVDGFDPYTPQAQVALMIGLLDELGVESAVLLGHDSGVRLALEVTMQRPDMVDGLILIGGTLSAAPGRSWLSRLVMNSPQMQRLGPVFLRQLADEPGVNIMRNGWADPSLIDEETYAAYYRAFTIEGWDTALWQMTKAEAPESLDGAVGGVNVPALVLAGAEDRTVPVTEAERLAAELPDATLRLLDGCGHYAQEECPDLVLNAIAEWWPSLVDR
ncbi:MAG TPA: alpha/beta hydrolase [Trueperaceae bacterium]|nr:alpha/beta hydrolase [Trueperaceae bacterium]